MNKSEPKISVATITYNQEKLIGRALDSIIKQGRYLHEIIVADDCSTDGTWQVVCEYCRKYPNIIKAFRHERNVGIFSNVEFTWTKITGNLIYRCAGDDELCEGLFEKAVERLTIEDIDYDKDAVAVYCDFAVVNPSGRRYVISNSLVEKHSPRDLKIRNLIFNRSVGYTRKVYNSFKHVPHDTGIYTDGLIDIQVQLYSECSYYFKHVGSIYYAGIGIGSKTPRDIHYQSMIDSIVEMSRFIAPISRDEELWFEYVISRNKYMQNKNISSFLRYLQLYARIEKIKYGLPFLKRETRMLIVAALKPVKTFFTGKK